jgi:hypothetical protein
LLAKEIKNKLIIDIYFPVNKKIDKVMKLGFTKNKITKPELDDTDIGHFFQLLTTKNNLAEKNISLFQDAFILGNLMMGFADNGFVFRSSKGLIKKMKKSEFVFAAGCQTIGDGSGH